MATRTSKSYLGTPEPFDAATDDWKDYVQRFKYFFLANGVTEASQKLNLFLTLVGAPTFKLLSNLIAPQEPGDLSYTEVIEKLTSHFKPKALKIAERFRFYKRNQLRAESVADYLAELRRLALTCEFADFLDEALCDRLVCGLRDEAIQRRLLAEADLTLTKALTLAQSMERAQKDLKEIHFSESDTLPSESAHNVSSRKPVCHRCLGAGHSPGTCRFKLAKCNKCYKTGHIARACRTIEPSKQTKQRSQDSNQGQNSIPKQQQQRKKTGTANQIEHEESDQSEDVDIVHVHNTVSPNIPKSYKVLTEINEIPITMELDTGAGVSIISEQTWSDKLDRPNLQSCNLNLHSYPNRPLDILGTCTVKVTIHGKTAMLPLVVVRGNGISLLGRNWLEVIQLNWTEVARINGITKPPYQEKLSYLLKEYENIFRD